MIAWPAKRFLCPHDSGQGLLGLVVSRGHKRLHKGGIEILNVYDPAIATDIVCRLPACPIADGG